MKCNRRVPRDMIVTPQRRVQVTATQSVSSSVCDLMCVSFHGMQVIDLIHDLISSHSDTSTGYVRVCICVSVCVCVCMWGRRVCVCVCVCECVCVFVGECVSSSLSVTHHPSIHPFIHPIIYACMRTLSANALISSGQVALNMAVCLSVGPSPALGHLENILKKR